MPYYGYYGGYGDFLANNIYCILLIPVLLLSLWAQAQVSGNFRRYSGVANRRRLTGAQAAEAVLRAHGVYDVAIRPCSGQPDGPLRSPGQHHFPVGRCLQRHLPSRRWAWRPTRRAMPCSTRKTTARCGCGRPLSPPPRSAPSFLSSCCWWAWSCTASPCFSVGILLFSLTTIFQLVTLPVEFNASHRALQTHGRTNSLLDEDELPGARKVLRAAALTYVAALLMSACCSCCGMC